MFALPSTLRFALRRFFESELRAWYGLMPLWKVFWGYGVLASLVMIGLYALAGTSFFMSIMFPTIFASAIRGLGPLTKIGSSFLIMAIIGGAVFTPIIGKISAVSHISNGMIVPAICFAFIAFYAFKSRPPAAVQAS